MKTTGKKKTYYLFWNFFIIRDTEFSLGSISNFERKVQSYFKQKEHDVEYWNLPALNHQASSHSFDSISPYCDKISFTKSLISSHLSYSGLPVLFSNGSVLEISKIWVKDHELCQKWPLGSRPPIKPNFWNKLAAWCAKQNFEQNEGLFEKIECVAPE